jgi:predicted DNA binding CopG/RHH family protein
MKKLVVKNKKINKIPKFKTEKEESLFWQKADSFKYLDWDKAEKWVFPNLKLTSTPITIRVPENLLNRVKIRAHQRDIPYQTLIKQFIYDGLEA